MTISSSSQAVAWFTNSAAHRDSNDWIINPWLGAKWSGLLFGQEWLLGNSTHGLVTLTSRGALLQLWGAGNLPDDPDLLAVIAKASGEGKLIAAISQCSQGRVKMGAYAAGNGLVDAGVLSGDDMTPEAVYTKLVHLIAQPLSPEDRRERFMMPLVGER